MTIVYRGVGLTFVTTLSLLMGCDAGPTDAGAAPREVQISSITDLGVIDQGSALTGRDGGYSGFVNNDINWAFGDSVFALADARGNTWLSNSSATGNPLAAGGSALSILTTADATGRPRTLLSYTAEERQFNLNHQGEDCLVSPCGDRIALWPGPLVRDERRDRTLLFYSKIHASLGEFNFESLGHSIAIWHDGELQPERPVINANPGLPSVLFGGEDPPIGAGAILVDDYLYAFACEINDTVKPCILARAPIEEIQQRSQWKFWTGNEWHDNPKKATELFHGNDIMSVHYDETLQRFIAVYSKPLSRTIQMRTSAKLTGPWSRPVFIATAEPTANGNGWVYDGLAHPEIGLDDPTELYITYTRDTGYVREMRLLKGQLEPIIND